MKAQLDRVISSQPMKRQETAAEAEVRTVCSIRELSDVLTLTQMRGLRRQLKQLQVRTSTRDLWQQ
jgi:hypothetical protein